MSFEDFIAAAWNDHADRPQEVAARLAASAATIATPADVAAYARIVTHVYGEHLGDWEPGIALLRGLRELPCWDGSAMVDGALTRSIAVLRHARGDDEALDGLSEGDKIAVLATVSSAFVGRHEYARALSAYASAVSLAQAGLPPGSPALRALAVGGDNLAAALEEKQDRNDAEACGMVDAAERALEYWKLAGTWLEEERAEYRLARSLLEAGAAPRAVVAASRCVDGCERNDAPAFERFFAYAALSLAHRAAGDGAASDRARGQALEAHSRIPADERRWCAADLAALH